MQNHRAVIVIGAGISGLVCAYRLKSLGVDVLLVEKSDRVGGVIQSERIDGYLIERGPNSSQGTEELLELVEELGISNSLLEGDPKAPAYVYLDGKLHPVPNGPKAFFKSELLSFAGKLRIFKEPFVRARKDASEESVASFARRRIGREPAERLVAPFVSGIYAGDAERISVQAAFPRLANLETGYGSLFRGALAKAKEARRAKNAAASDGVQKPARPRRRLCSFDQGMSVLPNTLASKLGEDLWTGCDNIRVEGQLNSARGFKVEFGRAGNRQQVTCDRLTVATPANVASSLVSVFSTELAELLGEIEYPPLSIVSLTYDLTTIADRLEGFGFLVPPSEGLTILGCVWNSSLFKNRAPEGMALLTAFVGGARNPSAGQAADAELVSMVHRELQRVLGITSDPRVIAITRYQRSIPQYNVGHFARVQMIESLKGEVSGLSLIGNYLHGVSTGDCIKEADLAARKIAVALFEGK